MNERAGTTPSPYWQEDILIGAGQIEGEPTGIRLRLHRGIEPYHAGEELLPYRSSKGPCLYTHSQPYILTPDITLTVGVYPESLASGVIGQVLSTDWIGMRQRVIGEAQAWSYPDVRAVVLWECYLHDAGRQGDEPDLDPNLAVLWHGFEQVLLRDMPQAERIVTPSWEDLYERAAWQSFLRAQGYGPVTPRAYSKEIVRTAGS